MHCEKYRGLDLMLVSGWHPIPKSFISSMGIEHSVCAASPANESDVAPPSLPKITAHTLKSTPGFHEQQWLKISEEPIVLE